MDRGGVIESEPTTKSVALSKEKGEASKCPAATAASPLALRHLDASDKQDKEAELAAKREAAAKYKAEQVAAAEERKRQEEADLAERKERERIANEQRLERIRLAEEKLKVEQEAEKRDEEVVRLAMRQSVGSCVVAIRKAAFDEYDPGTLVGVLADYDRATFDEAVGKLLPDMSDKVKACMRNNPWNFE
jgi:hypothetical protein